MRTRLLEKLYLGSVEDCEAVSGEPGWFVVHACKYPCHANQCGPKVAKDAPDYLSKRVGDHLFLNIIDPKLPLFQKGVFDAALAFLSDVWTKKGTILIHCNKGESRAPSIALLFIAKRLFKITNASYDDAWDEFEKLVGEKYTPSEGIETWLREHWHDFAIEGRIPSEKQMPAALQALPEHVPTDAEELRMLALNHPIVHFAGFCQIEDKENRWIQPTPNTMQFAIDEAYDWCMANNVPCRLMNLKPRQVGSSTKFAHLCWHHMQRHASHMMVMGDVSTRTVKVYNLFNGYSTHDEFAWENRYTFNTEKGILHRPDGTQGLVEQATALDPKAGIAGTRQIVWLTEAARYKKTNGNDKKVIMAVMNSLANVPKSLGIAESTPEGASGWFYDNWQGAVTLEQRKLGIMGNGWIKVFSPWFAFPEHSLQKNADNGDYFSEELDDRERRGITLYHWTSEQIAWRRMKIKVDCAGDAKGFDQDFAEDPASCFLASGRNRFNMEAVTNLEKIANVTHHLAEVGVLERPPGGDVTFMPSPDGNAWLRVFERPTVGFSYLGFLDPCTGEQNEGSQYPDAHAFGILRAGYFEGNRWHNTKLVACIDIPTGCRWDDEVLAAKIKLALLWYGDCMIVPETGNGLGALSQLKQQECVIYQREKMDAMYPGEKLLVNGWETNKDTRPLVVNEIANYIREKRLDCDYLPAIEEMKVFIVNDRGRAEAKQGAHDDWIMGLGIGLFCLPFAQPMPPPRNLWGSGGPQSVLGGGGPLLGGLAAAGIS